jgi:hypothetical protein
MAETYTPRPENRREFMNKLVTPYDPTVGNPNDVFSDPLKPGEPEFNRAYEISLDKDTTRNVSVGIKDIDEAIMYYFNNRLKLSVIQNNTRVMVPVIYGTPERWKAVQADGYYRDNTGKVQCPLIIYRRTSIEANRELGNKLDGNKVNNLILVKKEFNRRNIYDNFNVLTNRKPVIEYVAAFPPDYVTITYECIIYTNFVEQMDKLIEAINFASNSYWGDPSKFQFKTRIDSYSNQIVVEQGSDRTIKTSFNMVLNGYIIPDSVNKELATINRTFAPSQIVFGIEVAESEGQQIANIEKKKMKRLASVVAADSTNVLIQNISGVPQESLNYISTNIQLLGTFVNSTTVTYNKGWLTAPSGFPATSIDNFSFFCNGLVIEKNAIVSFTQSSGTSTLVINPSVLGYSFSNTDEVVAVGKFTS